KKRKSHSEIEVDLALPEPPSKKAKRALKKGKPLPVKPSSDDEGKNGGGSDNESAEGEDDKKKSSKKPRSPYGVWVGNLRFTTTKSELRAWLVDNSGGVITTDDITRVHMPTSKEKKGKAKAVFENKGFAYVDFASFEANVAAIALSETEMNGRKLLIKDAKSFEGRPKKAEVEEPEAVTKDGAKGKEDAKAKKDTRTKVFVGNLSFRTDEETLWEHFAKCGAIRWVKVATFEDTGKCKGYAWVNFEEHDAAAWAVKGFIKIKEAVETVEDFIDKDDDDEDGDAETPAADAQTPRQTKTRKWWVNRLQGRELKIELAEEDAVRQKKRFGKGGKANSRGAKDGDEATAREGPAGQSASKPPRRDRKEPTYGDANTVARLKGSIVESQGTKITFD
ncbi:hypothetical protein GQ53DRAFT_595292, partial [Thozetella sp. PMI_491]